MFCVAADWLSRDPIGENGGINLYCYVANDPIGGVDPDGRLGWIATGLIGAGADFSLQLVEHLIQGDSLRESLCETNWKSVGISGAASAAGYGLFGAVDKISEAYRLYRAATTTAKTIYMIDQAGGVVGTVATDVVRQELLSQASSKAATTIGIVGGVQAAKALVKHQSPEGKNPCKKDPCKN